MVKMDLPNICGDRQSDDESTVLLHKHISRGESYVSHFQWLVSSIIPLMGMKSVHQFSMLINVSAVGYLGAEELAGMSLALMLNYSTFFPLTLGITSALDTLCGRAWTGAKDKTIVGIYVQQALSLFGLLMIPLGVFCGAALYMLRYGPTDAQVIHYAGVYLIFSMLTAMLSAGYHFFNSLLQAQGIMRVGTYGAVAGTSVSIAATYILVKGMPFQLGIAGASLTEGATSGTVFAIVAAYIFKVSGSDAWGGWSTRCLRGWKHIMHLCVPGSFLILFTFAGPQICSLWATRLGTKFLAAHFVLSRTSDGLLTITFALRHAITTRIGNILGKGSYVDLKRTTVVAAFIAIVIGIACSTILLIFRMTYPYLFTKDDVVAQIVSEGVPALAMFQLFAPFSHLGLGICEGFGRQRVGAFATLVAYFIIGLPLCYYYAFIRGWSVLGLWIGLAAAQLSIVAILYAYLWNLDWFSEAQKVRLQLTNELDITTH